jgi:hypothetical protein
MQRLISTALLSAALLLATPAGAQTLDTGTVRARFGDRGLTSIEAPSLGPPVRFTADDFAITIDGQRFESASLSRPSRETSGGRVTFRWTAGPYRLDVTYEAQPGWRFVSKRIALASAPAPVLHVDEVVVFRIGLATAIAHAFAPGSRRPNLGTADYGGAMRFGDGHGLLAVAQNPFLTFTHDARSFALRYAPDMDWDLGNGPFEADRGLLAPTRLTGRRLPAAMVPEWRLGAEAGEPGLDAAEIEAFTDMVRAFVLSKPASPVNVFVGWTANDYQIDVATPEGREEYKRLLDRAAEVGADYALYAPSDSSLSRR